MLKAIHFLLPVCSNVITDITVNRQTLLFHMALPYVGLPITLPPGLRFVKFMSMLRECSFEKCWGGGNGGQACAEFMWPPLNPIRNLPPPPTKSQHKLCSFLFILNTPIIYHATPSLIMHELWLIRTHIFQYHELQRNLHLPCLAISAVCRDWCTKKLS